MCQPVPVFLGFVEDSGKLKMLPYVRESVKRWTATLRGCEVDIIIRKHKKKRTNDQNAYYFGVVIPILANHFGYDNAEDVHSDLKQKFNPVKSKIDPNTTIGGSTAKMSTIEFMASDDSYVEKICRWAATEHGIYIPSPQKAEGGE